MESQSNPDKPQRIIEFAPGITDPKAFAKLVGENPFFVSGRYKTKKGLAEMRQRLEEIETSLSDMRNGATLFFDHKAEITYLTEQAILKEIIIRGALRL